MNHNMSLLLLLACATGTHAISDAYNFIKSGNVDFMICGATEACIHPVSIAGFSRMRALTTKFVFIYSRINV